MFDLLPDLSGQPAWVVVVVTLLLVAGTVGVKWIGRNAREGDEEGEGDQEGDRPLSGTPNQAAIAGSDAHTTHVLTKALDLLANELLACSAERDRVAANLARTQAELEQCNLACRRLAMRALEQGGDSGERD
jgi:hypothetical protein